MSDKLNSSPTSSPVATDDIAENDSLYVVAALYLFVDLGKGCNAHVELREPILTFLRDHSICGTLLLAHEGINGTVAGKARDIDGLINYLHNEPIFDGLFQAIQPKYARVPEQPFNRTKVRLKREIVTMGVDNIDPRSVVGTYVEPQDWNELIDREDVVLIDTRNTYETEVGTFQSKDGRDAIDPRIEAFREFPRYTEQALDPERDKKVAMFCTGGIRCEKATAYLLQQGFDEVFHLKGGILKYLEEIPEEQSRWKGECFVFDERVTVDQNLEPGAYVLCYGCRRPVHTSQQVDPRYHVGVSCPTCFDSLSPDRRKRLEERHHQVELAKRRGERHIGDQHTNDSC